MLMIENAKYASWLTDYTFETCKLKRAEYGEFIANYITGERTGFVLNLDGAWGTGKTEFLKRLYSELLHRKHPAIYINAWESDFSKNPLTVVTSELLHQLEAFNKEICNSNATKEVKKFFAKVLQGTAIATSGVLSKTLTGDASIGIALAKNVLDDDASEKFIDKLSSEYQEQAKAIGEIRDKLHLLALDLKNSLKANLPIIVLIDELDRCRPNYSVEMLETIKHFFNTDNFVFVVTTDTEQLCHSVTAIYGNEFDSKQYLKRFFDRKATLPEPDLECYLNELKLHEEFKNYTKLDLYPQITKSPDKEFNKYIITIAKAYDLKIRDIDQLIYKLFSCLRTALRADEITDKKQSINILVLLIALVEFDKEIPEFKLRGDNNPSSYPLPNQIPYFKSINLDKLVEVSLESAVRYSEITDSINGTRTELRYMRPSTLRSIANTALGSDFLNWTSPICRSIEIQNQTNGEKIKYWLWDDYKRVVELAGNLS